MDNNKEIYLNNIEILASALLKAIEECNNDKTSSSMKYVYAYLFGAIGVISSFFEYAKSIDKSIEEDNIFKAIQYAFDLLKHNPRIATLANRKAGQGISFPFGGSFAFIKTEIIWIAEVPDNKRDKNRYREAYINLFAGKPIDETIQEIIRKVHLL